MKKGVCKKHGKLLPEDCYITKSSESKDGFRSRCKKCMLDKRLAASLQTRQENVVKSREWRRNNREKVAEWRREDYKNNPEKYKAWAAAHIEKNGAYDGDMRAARRFKISLEEYYSMIDSQGNRCAVCKEYETRVINGKFCRLCVDHDHKTGKIRGLLCHDCNTALGKFEDNVERIRSAIEYLNKHKSAADA